MAATEFIDSFCALLSSNIFTVTGRSWERINVDSFNFTNFWAEWEIILQELTKEVTKVSYLCSNNPFFPEPMLCTAMNDIPKFYLMFWTLFRQLPEEVGKSVYNKIVREFCDFLPTFITVMSSFKNLSPEGEQFRFRSTRAFWDACTSLNCLPKNNHFAVLNVIEGAKVLVADAERELKEYVPGSESESKLLKSSCGLVKVSFLTLRKVLKAVISKDYCSSVEHNQQLDSIAEATYAISPAIDEFVSDFYHPIVFSDALANAGVLVVVLKTLLASVKESYIAETFGIDNFDKVSNCIDYNHKKVDPSISYTLPDLSYLSMS